LPAITDKAMQAKPGEKDIWLKDDAPRGQGRLEGRITPAGSRIFYYRYTTAEGARERITIGPYSARGDGGATFTVQQAREKVAYFQSLHRSGFRQVRAYVKDKHEEELRLAQEAKEAAAREEQARREAEQQAAAERARRLTVQQLFSRWQATDLRPHVLANGDRQGRKDGGALVEQQFRKHVFPLLGERLADEVRRADVMEVLDRIKAAGLGRTTNVVLSSLRQMFTFALVRELVRADPTHGISKKRDGGGKDVERDRYLTEAELVELARLAPGAGLNARTECAIWLILGTACRIGELMGTVWSDATLTDAELQAQADAVNAKVGRVDLASKTWKIFDTKNQQDHLVHLSDFTVGLFQQLAALREVDDKGKPLPWVFPNSLGKGPVCTKSINKQLQDRQRSEAERMSRRSKNTNALALPGGRWTPHDLRRTAATLMSRLGVAESVIHLCLNHKPQDKLARIYIRDDRMDDRKRAFDALGLHLARLKDGVAVGANVVSIRDANVPGVSPSQPEAVASEGRMRRV